MSPDCEGTTCYGTQDPSLAYDDSTMDKSAHTHFYILSSSSSFSSRKRCGGTKWGHAPNRFSADAVLTFQRPALDTVRKS
jgi:hypothetical protein